MQFSNLVDAGTSRVSVAESRVRQRETAYKLWQWPPPQKIRQSPSSKQGWLEPEAAGALAVVVAPGEPTQLLTIC